MPEYLPTGTLAVHLPYPNSSSKEFDAGRSEL